MIFTPRRMLLTLMLGLCGFNAALSQVPQARPASDAKAIIRSLVDTYKRSIDEADPELGATVWSTTADVSFIDPRGHERGWDEIARVFYGETMGKTFTKRHLTLDGDLTINLFGDAAVVEFDWRFEATLRGSGKILHTAGRESQVYVNLPDKGWRLVHVHYSGLPVTANGKGF